jgi:hypothetical protein
MIVTILYLQSKFELASMNTCGPVVVRVDVYFVTASQKMEMNNLEEGYAITFCVKLGEGATDS